MNKNLKQAIFSKKWEIVGSLMLLAAFAVPFLSFAGSKKDIYVSYKASGTQNGSAAHPYKTISEALKNAPKNSVVHVLAGTYKENIEIPKDVDVFGDERSTTIIEAADRDKPVVKMKDESRIDDFTIRKGKNGIEVKEDAEVSIIDMIIEDNHGNGIKVEEGSTKNSTKVSISENIIRDNDGNGIYSKKRRVVIMDNDIINNRKDGVNFEKGVSAWISGNQIKKNNASGMKMVLDESNIWTKSNTFRDNDREGVEIGSYGKSGRIDLKKSKFWENDRYGIARISRNHKNAEVWKGLTIQNDNEFSNNIKGAISDIITIFN